MQVWRTKAKLELDSQLDQREGPGEEKVNSIAKISVADRHLQSLRDYRRQHRPEQTEDTGFKLHDQNRFGEHYSQPEAAGTAEAEADFSN